MTFHPRLYRYELVRELYVSYISPAQVLEIDFIIELRIHTHHVPQAKEQAVAAEREARLATEAARALEQEKAMYVPHFNPLLLLVSFNQLSPSYSPLCSFFPLLFRRALQLEEERRRVELARMESERAALAAKLAEEQEKSLAEIAALKAAREQLAAEADAKVKVRV